MKAGTSRPGWKPVKAGRWILVLAMATVAVACTAVGFLTSPAAETELRLSQLGGRPCPESEFICVSIEVPWDHTDSGDPRTLEVEFAVRPADREPEGVLVVVVGGPGGSGIEATGRFGASLDSVLTQRLDVVFFDQRGVGMFEADVCPETDESFGEDEHEGWDDWDRMVEVVTTYLPACVREMGDPAILAYLGTDQAVGDLEVFRQVMGYDQLTILGQSYGTAYAQTYATRYPESVQRLVLDGTIDLATDMIELRLDRVEGMERILDRMFDWCDADEQCSQDMTRPARVAYDRLLVDLDAWPTTVRFPLGGDDYEEIPITAEDITGYAFDAAYDDELRMIFLRALASATVNHNLLPMARLNAFDSDLDGEWVMYRSVVCRDSSIPGLTPSEEISTLEQAYFEVSPSLRWLVVEPLTCVRWPHYDTLREPAAPFVGEGIRTLLIASLDDPTTPYEQSLSVLKHLADGHLITVDGGSHVMFGRGETCIDLKVRDFILDGLTSPDLTCHVPAPYYPPMFDPDGSREWRLFTLEEELYYLPELMTWGAWDGLWIGCRNGGDINYNQDETSITFEMNNCGITRDWSASGEGRWDFVAGYTTMTLRTGDGCTESYWLNWGEDDPEVTSSCD